MQNGEAKRLPRKPVQGTPLPDPRAAKCKSGKAINKAQGGAGGGEEQVLGGWLPHNWAGGEKTQRWARLEAPLGSFALLRPGAQPLTLCPLPLECQPSSKGSHYFSFLTLLALSCPSRSTTQSAHCQGPQGVCSGEQGARPILLFNRPWIFNSLVSHLFHCPPVVGGCRDVLPSESMSGMQPSTSSTPSLPLHSPSSLLVLSRADLLEHPPPPPALWLPPTGSPTLSLGSLPTPEPKALPHCSQKFQNKQEVPGTLCTPPSMGAASPHLCTMRFGWKVSRACLLTCFLLISTTLHTSLDLYQLSQYLVLTATCITPLALWQGKADSL